MKTGVYLCQTGTGDLNAISVHGVASYAGNLPNVEVVRDLGVLPKLDTAALADELRREGL